MADSGWLPRADSHLKSIHYPLFTIYADISKRIFNLRPYDTGKAKRYEVPAEWTEEVSLTSLTGRSKSKKKDS